MRLPKNLLLSAVALFVAAALVASIIAVAVWNSNGKKNVGFGAVASNGFECAEMGKKIFEKGGNVADVAVTTILCEGIASPQSCGIGGGFVLTMYLKDKKIVTTLNARERAPRLGTADMFLNASSTTGGKAVAVPGDFKGLWELHQKFGNLPWAELIQPNIDLCKNGIEVTEYLEGTFRSYRDELFNEPSLREIFINPITGEGWKEGAKLKRPKLAETLEIIARDGADAIYGGGIIGKMLVEDVQARGGILTEKDLKDFRVEWRDSVSTTIINNMTLHAMPLPSSGSMMLLMINILRDLNVQPTADGFHKIVEAFKIGFAHRSWIGAEETDFVKELVEKMGRKDYADLQKVLINEVRTNKNASYYGAFDGNDIDDHGTAHLSILAPNGDAISVTNTINDVFGAMFRSPQTGIILNDEMDDFSTPGNVQEGVHPSPNNFVIPYNNPISSMVPTLVIDQNGDVKLVIGGAGGRRIITGTFLTLYRHLYFRESLEDAMNAPRLHHQLVPGRMEYETRWNEVNPLIISQLNSTFDHNISSRSAIASLTAISTMDGETEAYWDSRRSGSAEVFEIKY